MTIWAWLQPTDRIWKVVTDHNKGIIQVYNEKENLMLEEKGLNQESVFLIEENFLEIVAKKLTSDSCEVKNDKKKYNFNPMYA